MHLVPQPKEGLVVALVQHGHHLRLCHVSELEHSATADNGLLGMGAIAQL